LDVHTQQQDHVTNSASTKLHAAIGILLLHSSDLLPVLLNSSPEFHKPVGLHLSIGRVMDRLISQYSLDGGPYAGGKALLGIKWHEVG
jgi:hypothetical protein